MRSLFKPSAFCLSIITLIGLFTVGCSATALPTPTPAPATQASINPDETPLLGEQGNTSCQPDLPGTSGRDAFGCPTEIDPFSELIFDDALHESWYRRFWTGSCAGVNAFCLGGEGWFDRINLVSKDIPDAQRGALILRMWALGRVVGYDWARDNTVSSFVTGDIQRWNDIMNRSENIADALVEIEQEVCERLGTPALAGFSPAKSCNAEA